MTRSFSPGLARGLVRWVMSVAAGLAATTGLLLLGAPAASAHPLGNFTVNTATAVRVEPVAVAVDVVLDLAEIPTLQAFPDPGSGDADSARGQRFAASECAGLREAVEVTVGGRTVALTLDRTGLAFPPGEAGLATTRLSCHLRSAGVTTVGRDVVVRSDAGEGRVGWHELTAVGDGVSLAGSDVPARSPSATLTDYPEDLLSSPVDVRDARFTVRAGSDRPAGAGDGAGMLPGGLDRVASGYTDLVASARLTVGFAVVAVLLAMGLGALHAFAPGHGKSLMAAYLVGREGSLRQAAVIGLSVTATHTLGVLVLGITLSTVAVTAPERVYPWLGLASGLLLAGVGAALLRQALRRRVLHWPGQEAVAAVPAEMALLGAGSGFHHGHHHDHHHGHHHDHEHHHEGDLAHEGTDAGRHSHGLFSHSHAPTPPTSVRGLVAVGFAGGLVPSPSALLVLLGGIALGRAWFGVLLVLAYGVGMALALVATGLALVRARDLLARWTARAQGPAARRAHAATAVLPALTALAVVGIGVAVAGGALLDLS